MFKTDVLLLSSLSLVTGETDSKGALRRTDWREGRVERQRTEMGQGQGRVLKLNLGPWKQAREQG